MAISYYWTINSLECYPTSSEGPDYVFSTRYQFNATETVNDKIYTASITGVQNIPSSTGSVFIPFTDLTLEIVQGWIETAMESRQIDAMKATLAQNIANQINPPLVTLPSPWLTGSL